MTSKTRPSGNRGPKKSQATLDAFLVAPSTPSLPPADSGRLKRKSRPKSPDLLAEIDDDFFDDFIGEDDENEESLDFKLPSSKRPRTGNVLSNPRKPLADISANTPAPKSAKTPQGAPRGYKARTSSAAKDPNRTVENLPPRDVLNHMLKGAAAHVSKDKSKPFENFVARHGLDKTLGYLKSSFKPWVWDNLIEGDKATDIAYLKDVPNEKRLPPKPGFYIGIVEDDNDPDYVALYGGQGSSILSRIWGAKGHRWSVLNANKGSLLYFFWRGDSRDVPAKGTQIDDLPRKCKFVCAGTDESGLLGQDQSDFWDLGEMFLTLMLRSLQVEDLEKWLPADCSTDTPVRRANIQLPLFQNHKAQSFDLHAAIHSTDPAVAAYAQQTLHPKMSKEQEQKRDHRLMEKTTIGSRKKGKNQDHFRGPDASLGDPDKVKVKCLTCGTEKWDTQVQFLKSDGRYCARSTACPKCPPTDYQKTKGLKHAIKMFHPVDIPKEKWVEKDRLRFK